MVALLHHDSIEKFCLDIANEYETIHSKDDTSCIVIVAKYNEAEVIARELDYITGFDVDLVDFIKPDCGYNDEYYIEIFDNMIMVEPAVRNNKYIFNVCDIVYIFDNCSSAIIPFIDHKYICEIGIIP